MYSLDFSIYKIILFTIEINTSFPNWTTFISFSYLVVLCGTPNAMLKRSTENRYLCLVLDLNRKVFTLSP